MATNAWTFKQRIAGTFAMTLKIGGELQDLTGYSFLLGIRKRNRTEMILTKEDADFDKSRIAESILLIPLSVTDTDLSPGDYIGELRLTAPGVPENVFKTVDIEITILLATTP